MSEEKIDPVAREVYSLPGSLEYPIEPRSKLDRIASFFSSARRLRLAWSSAILTAIFLILTTLYASQASIATRVHLLYTSSSNTIFVLSALSGLTGVFLAGTIAATFERLQWLLLSRKDGLQFTKFLGLQAGTGVPGLLVLTVGAGQPLMSSTRLWSAARLMSTILVPALGILIMSNVNTRLTFDGVDQQKLSLGWGMTPFNASLAKNATIVADQLLQAQQSGFLSNPSRAVDITPKSLRSIPCSQGPNSPSDQSCERTFFLPGGVEFAAPRFHKTRESFGADVFLAKEQQGYLLNYRELGSRWHVDDAAGCQVYGFPFAAFHLCLKNVAENIVDAWIVQCPSEFSSSSQCRNNSSWHSSPGWATRLTASFRRATTAYSRTNGTIISHTFSDGPAVPAPVNARDLLQGYRDAFGDFNGIQDFLKLLANPDGTKLFPLYVYPAFVWACLKGVTSLGSQNPAVVTRAADALQCLFAIMLYYCQPSLYARAVMEPARNGTAATETFKKFAADMVAIAPPDTEVFLSGLRYQIVVGRATLLAYVLLSGVTLILCLGVLVFGSCSSIAVKMPDTGPFPTWDSIMNCEVEYRSGAALDHGHYSPRALKGKRLVRAATDMKIRLMSNKD